MNTVTKLAKIASIIFGAGDTTIPTAARKAAKQEGFGDPSLTLRVLTIVNDAEGYGVTEKHTLVEAIATVLGTHGAEKKSGRKNWSRRIAQISPPLRKPVQASPVVARMFQTRQEQLQLL